ncbi:MAG: bactofilin family protein [Armatimonadota bacterium]
MKTARKRSGVMFVLAVIGLAVMTITGTAFIGLAANQLVSAERQLDNLHAVAAAEGGINYIIWRQKYTTPGDTNADPNRGSVTPYDSASLVFPPSGLNLRVLTHTGSPAPLVNVTPDSGEPDLAAVWLYKFSSTGSTVAHDGYQAVSEGNYRLFTRKLRVVFPLGTNINNPEPPELPELFKTYAVFGGLDFDPGGGNAVVNGNVGSNGEIKLGGNSLITGNVNTPSSITLSGNNASITGLAEYGTTVKGKGFDDTSNTGHTVPFPDIDYNAWLAAAQADGLVVNGDYEMSGNFTFPEGIIYITGDLTIAPGTVIDGTATLIVLGNVNINGSVANASGNAVNMAILTASDISIAADATLNAFLYAHTSEAGEAAEIKMAGQVTINGSVIADEIHMTGQATVNYAAPVPPVVPPPPTLPEWNSTSWEQM